MNGPARRRTAKRRSNCGFSFGCPGGVRGRIERSSEDCGTILSQWMVTTYRETKVSGVLTGCNLDPRATRGCAARYRLQVAMTTAVMLGGCLGGRGSLDGKVVDVANGGAPVPGAMRVLTRSRAADWGADAT